MSVSNWKERYNPILVLCIAVAFCAALYLMQILTEIDPERYGQIAEETGRRREKASRRKKETLALKKEQRNGQRRTNG